MYAFITVDGMKYIKRAVVGDDIKSFFNIVLIIVDVMDSYIVHRLRIGWAHNSMHLMSLA
jgi:hypothetical protein